MAFSKTATLILLIHTLTSSIAFIIIDSFNRNVGLSNPQISQWLQDLPIHIIFITATLFATSIFRCCCSQRTRIPWKRHFITAFFLAPLAARLLCWNLGLVDGATRDGEILWTAACYDQMELSDPDVVLRTSVCEHRFEVSKTMVKEKIGIRRKRLDYVVELARACMDLTDVRLNGGEYIWCWVGKDLGVKNELEFFKGKYEGCFAKFGVEVGVSFKDNNAAVFDLKLPSLDGNSNSTNFRAEVDDYDNYLQLL